LQGILYSCGSHAGVICDLSGEKQDVNKLNGQRHQISKGLQWFSIPLPSPVNLKRIPSSESQLYLETWIAITTFTNTAAEHKIETYQTQASYSYLAEHIAFYK